MSDLNQCNFIGRLGADPEIKYLPNGDAVANFSIAVSDKWTDKQSGESRENTEWVRIVAYRKLAEIMGQYLKKGSQVFIGGKLKTRKWQDQSGQDRYTTEIVADQMQMLGSKDGNGRPQGNSKPQGNSYAQAKGGYERKQPPQNDFEDDDIPF